MEYEIKRILNITDGEYKGYKEVLFVNTQFVLDRVYVLLDPNNHCTHFFSHRQNESMLRKRKEKISEITRAKGFKLQTIFSKHEQVKQLVHFKGVQELPKLVAQKTKIVCVKERLGIYGSMPDHQYQLFIQLNGNRKENISSWFLDEYISLSGSYINNDVDFPERLRSEGYNIIIVDREADVEEAFHL